MSEPMPTNVALATWGFPQDAPDYIASAVADMMDGFQHSTNHEMNERLLLMALHSACEEVMTLRRRLAEV